MKGFNRYWEQTADVDIQKVKQEIPWFLRPLPGDLSYSVDRIIDPIEQGQISQVYGAAEVDDGIDLREFQ